MNMVQKRHLIWIIMCVVAFSFAVMGPKAAASQLKTIQNSMGMTFVLVPAGTFLMGSPEDEPFRNKDEVLHKVTLTKPFYIQTTEVTEAQWNALMGRKWFSRRRGGNLPVVKISWYDCMEFLEKLNRLGEGRYRLPTEAEWEYACRAGSQAAYTWGKTIDCTQAMFANNSSDSRDCLDYATKRDLPMDGPAPVKSYPPNDWGIFDMHGNVWEWCLDWYGAYPSDSVTDPKGTPSGSQKVRRGGSWFKGASLCRSANRNFGHPASRYATLGFRVVREAE
jgi:formylglycine-generating enzyme required for sulfatase activity